ncbi:ABC transporter ATP-binding protein [Arthrobacter halodurans]|uniref:ABC transporter ATP-binding protein n=1 Tax=Arthrobacter halodurans TaxID=516699 RepID=A0ABV4UK58_9MICC
MTVVSRAADAAVAVKDPAVVLRDVSMVYRVRASKGRGEKAAGKVVEVRALNPLSLVVSHGESVGIVGRNGSGKSTLTKLIAGSILPTSGEVRASSTPVLLGVNAALVPELSGRQNVVLGCLAMGLDEARINEKFDSIVNLAGLADSINLPMRTYSSGMSARLRFAIAAAVDPEILMIDEALNTGDAQFRDRTRRRMDELRRNAGCVFLISHSLGTIRQMTNRALWIDDGDLLMDGDPNEVTAAYKRFTWLLSKNRQKDAAAHRQSFLDRLQTVEIVDTSRRG